MSKEWHAVDVRYQKNGQIRIFDSQGNHVANVLSSQENCGKTAAYIVRACEVYRRYIESGEVKIPVPGAAPSSALISRESSAKERTK
jgi:hypothetical protein